MRREKGKWREKILKRQPQKPFSNRLRYKVPVWFDYRIGSVEKSRIKLSPYVLGPPHFKRASNSQFL